MPLNQDDKQTIIILAKHLAINSKDGWNNFTKDYPSPDTLVLSIETIPQLQAVMKHVYALNADKNADEMITLRAAAGGKPEKYSQSFSFTDCASANIVLHLTGDVFNTIENLGNNTVRAGGSVQIGDLDKTLYEEHDLALPTSSLIPYVTVAGLSANGGHGTGKDQPGFAGLIQRMRLCLPNGDITTLDDTHPDFATIRGAHLGLFGVVIDTELQCTPAKKLKCTMDVNTVDEFIEKTKKGLFKQYPYVSAMYVPTYYEDERTRKTKNVIVYSWEPVDKDTPDSNNHAEWLRFSQTLMIGLTEKLNVMGLLRTFPSLIPYYMRYFVSKISVGNHDSVAIGPWHEIAHYQAAFPSDLHEYGALFAVSDATLNGVETPEMIAAFETLIETLTALVENEQYPLTYAAYLRYFQGTNGGLSINGHGASQHVCGMDMTTGQNIPGFEDFQQIMSDYCTDKLHGKPHWGKNAPSLDFKKLYGDNFTAFEKALQDWYTHYNMTLTQSPLLNDFAASLLGIRPRSAAEQRHATNPAPTCTPKEVNAICTGMLDLITENTKEANDLRRELRRVAKLDTSYRFFNVFSYLCPTWGCRNDNEEKRAAPSFK